MMDNSSDGDKLSALVLEDEWVARNFLVEIIENTGLAHVVGAVGAFDDAIEFLRGPKALFELDVVFVDINLVGSQKSGLDLVREFAGKQGAPAFVLATALPEHAVEAFALGVVDYVLKPFDKDRVSQCLERLRTKRSGSARESGVSSCPTRIVARKKRNLVFLRLTEVWAFEAAGGLSVVHSERGTFEVDLSLDAIAISFGQCFERVHRNWLVNAEQVLELERDSGESALLLGGRGESPVLRVPVARDRAATLRAHLIGEAIGIRRR